MAHQLTDYGQPLPAGRTYSDGTLVGNWAEDREDHGFYSARPALSREGRLARHATATQVTTYQAEALAASGGFEPRATIGSRSDLATETADQFLAPAVGLGVGANSLAGTGRTGGGGPTHVRTENGFPVWTQPYSETVLDSDRFTTTARSDFKTPREQKTAHVPPSTALTRDFDALELYRTRYTRGPVRDFEPVFHPPTKEEERSQQEADTMRETFERSTATVERALVRPTARMGTVGYTGHIPGSAFFEC